jgi:putative transposase
VSLEAQTAIDNLRKGSIAELVIQSDNGSSFIAMEFKLVLKENHLTQKLIRLRTPEQNGIVERANKTMRESLAPVILTDYEHAKSEISRIIQHYNNERKHSSLQYLTPVQYYRGDPDVLLAIREYRENGYRNGRRRITTA